MANAYRGELLGLMAVHLVLLGVNKLYLDLVGKITVYSDCDGALQKVENLPPLQIPLQCQHADILKNIFINCSSLTFKLNSATSKLTRMICGTSPQYPGQHNSTVQWMLVQIDCFRMPMRLLRPQDGASLWS